jgi:hypothetical protein
MMDRQNSDSDSWAALVLVLGPELVPIPAREPVPPG